MVLVEEVTDESFANAAERESDFVTDSDPSDIAVDQAALDDDESDFEDDDFSPEDETIYDRLVALKDIVPPRTRNNIVASFNNISSWTKFAYTSTGMVAWWITTSALLVGLPLALAIEDEARITQQEKELQMQNAGQQQLLGGPQPAQQGDLPPGF